jgi:hypothetical protein
MATLIAGQLVKIIAIDCVEYKLQELCFLRRFGIRNPEGTREFLFSKNVKTGFGPNQLPIQHLRVNFLCPPSVEVMKEWSFTSTALVFLQVMYIKTFAIWTPTNLGLLF